MAYSAAEARQQLLDEVAEAVDHLAVALAALGEAYEHLDEQTAERLEEELFRPVQVAYGRARRTHAEFAERHGLPGRTFEPASAGPVSLRVQALLDNAVAAVGEADGALAGLQDSMMPVEVGDAELRDGLSAVRRGIADMPARARRLGRIVGR